MHYIATMQKNDPSPPAATRLRECPMCGLFQSMPGLGRGASAHCGRCGAALRHQRTDPAGRALALATTAMLLFGLAASQPFLELQLRGQGQPTTLFTGPEQLESQGMWELALVVLITTTLAPLAKLGGLIWVLVGLRLPRPPRHLATVFRWVELLGPWAMVEVFMLGVFVAYTKLSDMAAVQVGTAVYALGAIMLAMAAADAALDHEAIWEEIERQGLEAEPDTPGHGPRIGCDSCGFVSHHRHTCPRCGGRLHHRKPNSMARTAALLLAAAVLYVPANLLPVTTVIQLGRGSPSTILSGVEELGAAGQWPLALLVFVASISVPVLKLIGLGTLLITTKRRMAGRLGERTLLYRIVDAVGRWSMIDVFMISILTAVVHMGQLASVIPGPGVICFCAVVILTMVASHSFDPRLMWDAAEPPASRTPE
jgi:paraquat-inducible protein A